MLETLGKSISSKARVASKIDTEYKDFTTLPAAVAAQQGGAGPARPGAATAGPAAGPAQAGTKRKLIEGQYTMQSASRLDCNASRSRKITDCAVFVLPCSPQVLVDQAQH